MTPSRPTMMTQTTTKNRSATLIMTALAAALVAGSAAAAPTTATPPNLALQPRLPAAPRWKAPTPASGVTPAGTRVVVLPSHELPLVHVMITVRAGSDLDPDDEPGLAAAVAMMVQDGGAGTRTAPQVAEAFADLGAELHARVDPDGVRLALSVRSGDLDRALALVGDLLARPRFDAAEWPRARDRRLAEIQRSRDEPREIADNVFLRALYGQHAYGHPWLGTPAALGRISVDDVRAFYQRHYGPKTVAVVLVGDATLPAALGATAQALAGWAASARPAPPPARPSEATPRFIVVDRPGAPQSEVRVGHLGRERQTADFAALSLLETVLGGSFTSRLMQNLREKHGYTYGARARFTLWRAPGPFDAAAAVRTDVTAESLQEIVNELGGMVTRPPSPAEAQKGRSLVLSEIVEAFGDGPRTTLELADLVLHDLPLDAWGRLPAALAALHAPELARAARRLFHPDRLTFVVVGDRKTIVPALAKLPFAKSIEYRSSDGDPLTP